MEKNTLAYKMETQINEIGEKPEEVHSMMNLPAPTPPTLKGSDFVPQILACLAASAILIQTGVNLAYSAVLIPQLMGPESDMRITEDQASWIASIVTIATTAGSLISGPLMDKYGRKSLCKFTCVPLILSWIVIAFTANVYGMYCGRLLAGLGAGLSAAPLVYISEVTHPRWRPTLLCLISTLVSLGILLTCILCLWLTYDKMAVCFAVLSLASYLVTWPIPESPHWLLQHRTNDKARKALKWLYRRNVCYQHQVKCLMESQQPASTSTQRSKSFLKYFEEYKRRSTIKPIVILMIIFIFQQVSGAYIIIFYAVNILQLIGGKYGSGISEYMAFALLGVIRFVMSICTAFASKSLGRRPVSIISFIGMAISMLVAAIFINASDNSGNLFQKAASQTDFPLTDVDIMTNSSYNTAVLAGSYDNATTNLLDGNSSMAALSMAGATFLNASAEASLPPAADHEDQWVPLLCVLIYVFFSSLGVLVIPWTLIGELPPISVRGSCGGFMMAFSYVMMFVVVKTFPYFLEIFKTKGIFYMFSVTSFFGAAFVFLFLPETRGKSFQEIESYFK